jgi:hypothetical protein
LSVSNVTFLHDKAPCFKALATQQLLRDENVCFFGNDERPGYSPDLNVAENMGAVIKARVEKLMLQEVGIGRYSQETLLKNLQTILNEMETNKTLFITFLKSYPACLNAVELAYGGHTEY